MHPAVKIDPPTLAGKAPSAAEEIGVIVIEGRSTTPLGPKILFANEAMARLSGYKLASLRGSALGLIYDRKDLRHLIAKLPAIAEGSNHCFMDRLLLRNGGSKHLCRWTIRPTNREKEIPGHFALTVRVLPATAPASQGTAPAEKGVELPLGRKNPPGPPDAQAKISQGDKYETVRTESISLAAAGVAHDFKNALQTIRANVELAEVSSGPNTKISAYLGEALLALGDAELLARQMLAFTRGESGATQVFALGNLVERVSRLGLAGSRIRCHVEIPPDLRPVEGDPIRIYQVLHNLVMNARQAMPGGGPIFLTAGNADLEEGNRYGVPAGRYTVASVRDRGCGIEPAAIPKIFDADYSTKPGGNGFGLASCRDIVERHGGHIRVASVPGVGSEFLVFLPSNDSPAVALADFPSETEGKPATRKVEDGGAGKVLIVEDEPAVARSTRAQLKHLGYEAWITRDGGEAVEIFREHLDSPEPFEIVILDMTLPGGLDGSEVAAELHAMDPAIRMIATSGYFERGQTLPRGSNFSALLAKPYGLSMLGEVLDAIGPS